MRPTVLLEGFFLILTPDSVGESNGIRLPFGDGKTSPVAVEECPPNRQLLANPKPHIGRIYHLTGPQSENMDFFPRSTRRRLVARSPIRTFRSSHGETRCSARGLPAHLVHHLATMADLHRAGRYDRMSDDVLALTGQAPQSVREFVRKNAVTFTASAKAA